MSDEVSQFLEQVERLRGQQIEDDEVRARELEEFLAAKRERQARREERARSISPQKSSPVNTPSPRSKRRSAHLSDSLKLQSPTAVRDTFVDAPADAIPMALSSSPVKENEAPGDAPEAKQVDASTPSARSSPLSWQRRPNSRAGARPLSVLAAQNATQRSLAGAQEPASATEQAFSKDQIAQSLGSKDPAWFRQTADRGHASAAYRRSQVEDDDRLDMGPVKAQLPGMTAETPNERPSSRHDVTSPTQGRLGSPVSLNPPRQEVPADDKPLAEQAVTSPTGRTSPIRSASPTKGMGGFVQSAMMKRSDSVKRWSVTSPPGLSRADSSAMRNGSPTQGSSRPTSKHGEEEAEQEDASKTTADRDSTSGSDRAPSREDDAALPVSPTKTMDPRRWSPTKSSWLENALNKPDSPKLPPKPTQSQPAWMVELNKAKAERANKSGADASRSPGLAHKHQVSIGGLMRQSPVGETAKTNPTGLGGIYSPPSNQSRPAFGNQAKPSHVDKTLTRDVESPPKPKPETPPNKDFRANLRQRPAAADAPRNKEPEFRNAFGNLRRATTQNYVAPDELKNNILRGKAALNLTDGPRKGERKDEFKEAILKKREDFKKAQAEGKGVSRSSSNADEKPLPEGLVKRAELTRSNSDAKSETATETTAQDERKMSASPRPLPELKRTSSQSASSLRSPNKTPPPFQSPAPEKPGRKLSDTDAVKPTPESEDFPLRQKETNPDPKPQRAVASGGGGKLAGRFNPALAGMLARGPPAMATNGGQGSNGSGPKQSSGGGDMSEPSAPGPQLTHITKGRARGPRRKAPTGSSATTPAAASQSAAPTSEEPKRALPSGNPKAEEDRKSPVSISKEPERASLISPAEVEKEQEPPVPAKKKPAPLSIQQQVAAQAAVRGQIGLGEVEAKTNNGTGTAGPASPLLLRQQTASPSTNAEGQVSPPSQAEQGSEEASQPSSPRKLDESTGSTHQRTRSRSPTKLPEQPLPEPLSSPDKRDRDSLPSMKGTASRSSRPGSPIKSPPGPEQPVNGPSAAEATAPRPKSRGAPRPLSGITGGGLKSSPAIASPVRSPTKPVNEVSMLLSDFFGPPGPRKEMRVDPAEILMNRPPAGAKITSLGFHMFKIFGDGKKVPVSAQNERDLFEQEMYVCAHNFTNAAGKKVFEVYFWVGDEVPEATAEDAQLFVQREARSLGGTLVKLRQGKETAEFMQALGGVVIVRRGSSNKYDSLAPNMLCGRAYLGQVAFDEVDFAPASLCSGFTYLIAQAGKCFLWKGKGSDVAEVSCARLVGMDLTLTGEIVEYEDGAEPASFWDLFGGGGPKPHSADHWRLKPNYDKYCSRLFCSDADSKQQILELSPFGQADLSPSSIYILDAFFEMYIVVGSRANAQYASFRNALDFAQEYAILAAGIEDRPFVPVSSVVLEGIPRDLKRVFRKWDDARSPTATNNGTGGPDAAAAAAAAPGSPLKRGRSLRVVTLTQALQALSE
ncbi:gelsolin repeat protein [Hirsutella rhossiliensis]|uniref:Gelsolin repeat protein n=1 Tax=Hirsutella rhossiliensis TaxID=111463 RepID=A0A9P8N0M0_9HYPO|nr:gelsolin repeat protein [Hirsutella rhossiliensis]KAH0965963.1 gelsolin repeat protein [Hirsutella rhossiliensis]